MLSYLLGFPTPVIEIYAVLACSVITFALYFGMKFESITEDRSDQADDEIGTGVSK